MTRSNSFLYIPVVFALTLVATSCATGPSPSPAPETPGEVGNGEESGASGEATSARADSAETEEEGENAVGTDGESSPKPTSAEPNHAEPVPATGGAIESGTSEQALGRLVRISDVMVTPATGGYEIEVSYLAARGAKIELRPRSREPKSGPWAEFELATTAPQSPTGTAQLEPGTFRRTVTLPDEVRSVIVYGRDAAGREASIIAPLPPRNAGAPEDTTETDAPQDGEATEGSETTP